MTPESAAATLRRNQARAEVGGGAVRCEVDTEQLAAVLTVIRDELGFGVLSSITAVDEGDHIRLLYHLARPGDPEHTRLLLVEVRAAKGEHPEGPLVPSAVALYPGANLQEREIFDLMGVRFRGHPNLTRVLTWTGFHGHPLRKDYEPVDEEIPWRLAGLAGADGALISTDDAALAGDERAAVALVDAPAAEATGRVPPGRGELVKVNFGPHHPSTHGVLHLLLTLDGETVVDCEVIFGYLHRAIEKLAEQRTYVGGQALCDRLDYVAAMTNNHAWTLATEALLDIMPPLKVQVIRVMMDELSRIASHWIGTGVYGQDVGVLVTSVMWAFNWREEILDVFEDWCGQRMTYNYYRPGTVYPQRLPDGYEAKIRAICDRTPGRVEQMHRFLTRNAIFRERSVGVGGLSAADALAHSVTGPTLRGSGVAYDIRRARPYAIYGQLDFDVATRDAGDCMARYQVRLDEILESRRIVLQCLDLLREVDPDMGREPKQVKPAAGREAYVEVEGPKGAVGCYMKANGTPNPERMKWRSPSFINLGAFPLMVRGWKIADLISIFGSVDINMGEVDR